ncbi:MAG: hypothetical protein ACP5G2_05235 [Candidatus Bipolaricaulaceae bacterium]
MNRKGALLAAVLILAVAGSALADTVYLADGSVLEGSVIGVTAYTLTFRPTGDRARQVALLRVVRLEVAPPAGGEVPLAKEEWIPAMAQARRELGACRASKAGVLMGGLAFLAGGYWLQVQGHTPFGQLVTGIGAVATVLGLVSPAPSCSSALHRVEVLTRLGLAYDWVY